MLLLVMLDDTDVNWFTLNMIESVIWADSRSGNVPQQPFAPWLLPA